MKKNNKYIAVIGALLVAFILGFGIKACMGGNIAVVNLNRVLAQYPKIATMREENTARLTALSAWAESADKEINAEKNKTKKDELIRKYQEEARVREAAIAQQYNQALQEIDGELTALINSVARKSGCKIVLLHTAVISGGKDITDAVIAKIKE